MKIADAKIRVPASTPETGRTRRTYARQFKREVVAQCLVPGASVSAIALSHGINAQRDPQVAAAGWLGDAAGHCRICACADDSSI
jgi:hypothetical protein